MNVTAYAASVGHSVWFSHDLGETWNRAFTPTGGIYNESRAWCVATHPARPGDVLAGTDLGVYRWTVAADRWEHLPSPMDGLHILQIARSAPRSRHHLRRHAPGAGLALGRRRADLGSLRHGQRCGMRIHQHAAGDVDPFRPARSRHDLGHRRDRRHLRQPRRRRDLGEMQRRAEEPGYPQSRLL